MLISNVKHFTQSNYPQVIHIIVDSEFRFIFFITCKENIIFFQSFFMKIFFEFYVKKIVGFNSFRHLINIIVFEDFM